MEALFVHLMQWGKEQGYRWFALGMAPLSGFEPSPVAPLWNRLGAFLYEHGESVYNFQGLRAYKEKFNPGVGAALSRVSGRLCACRGSWPTCRRWSPAATGRSSGSEWVSRLRIPRHLCVRARLRGNGEDGCSNLIGSLDAEANLDWGTDADRSFAVRRRAQHERHLTRILACPRDDEPLVASTDFTTPLNA